MAKTRTLPRTFIQTHNTKIQNLLVSGCSMVWNNSEKDICSWPYYLRDLAGFKEVYDCSQSGAGTNHIFNSVINDIETGKVDISSTLILIMWSGLSRTDVIAESDITQPWHHMSNYYFSEKFATLSLFNNVTGNGKLDTLCRDFKKIVSLESQIYESSLKILALHHYLSSKHAKFFFFSWQDLELDLSLISNDIIAEKVMNLIAPVKLLVPFARSNGMLGSCGHPTPDGYLAWTQQYLIPFLKSQDILNGIN
jgi:hypothetical protein